MLCVCNVGRDAATTGNGLCGQLKPQLPMKRRGIWFAVRG